MEQAVTRRKGRPRWGKRFSRRLSYRGVARASGVLGWEGGLWLGARDLPRPHLGS